MRYIRCILTFNGYSKLYWMTKMRYTQCILIFNDCNVNTMY